MSYNNADEFMNALNEKGEAYKKKHSDYSHGFTEGLTWGMVNELIIERNQLRGELDRLGETKAFQPIGCKEQAL